ncbi:MAG: hypothetical protein ACLFXM_07500 [Acidimicrobiia bacterium]
MSTPRDEIWVDMVQFDTRTADAIWDGDGPLDAPRWYAEMAARIHAARAPADPLELADEPEVVDTMRRAVLGQTVTRVRRPAPMRLLGRAVAMKASAVVTVSVLGITAAAATIGTVATVVVPAIERQFVTGQQPEDDQEAEGSVPGPGTGDPDTSGAEAGVPGQCAGRVPSCADRDLATERDASRDGPRPEARPDEPHDGGDDAEALTTTGDPSGSEEAAAETSAIDEPAGVAEQSAPPATTADGPTTTTEQPTTGETTGDQPTTTATPGPTTTTGPPTSTTGGPAGPHRPTDAGPLASDRGAPDTPTANAGDPPPPAGASPGVAAAQEHDDHAPDPAAQPDPEPPARAAEPPAGAAEPPATPPDGPGQPAGTDPGEVPDTAGGNGDGTAPVPDTDEADPAADPGRTEARGRGHQIDHPGPPHGIEPPGPPDGVASRRPDGPIDRSGTHGTHRAPPGSSRGGR